MGTFERRTRVYRRPTEEVRLIRLAESNPTRALVASPHAVFHRDINKVVTGSILNDNSLFSIMREDGFEENKSFIGLMDEVGVGPFHCLLLFVCGFVYMTCAASMTLVSFILPAAHCQLDITSHVKGFINSASLMGMVLGTFLWGPMADSKGRRFTILCCLATDTLTTLLTVVSLHRYVLLIVRFLNGFCIIGTSSLIFAYMGEFIQPKFRDGFLVLLEIFWSLGIILVPLWAKFILPKNINEHIVFMNFHSWNMFVLTYALLPLISFILVFILPESPEFLLADGKIGQAVGIISLIHSLNKGTPFRFSISPVTPEELCENCKRKTSFSRELSELLKGEWRFLLLRTCCIDFLVNFSYLTLVLWLPTLFDRREFYKKLHSSPEVTLCKAAKNISSFTNEICQEGIGADVYTHTIIICISTLPFILAVLFAVTFVGKREVLVVITFVAFAAYFFLNFAKTNIQVIVCCIILEAMSTVIESLLFISIVELFPLHFCGLALSLTITMGRIAAVIGNCIFGIFLDTLCDLSMHIFPIAIFLAGLIACTLPKMRSGH